MSHSKFILRILGIYVICFVLGCSSLIRIKEVYPNSVVFKEYMVKKTLFQDSIKEGEYKEWHPNGNLKVKCMYKNGNLIGLYEQWHSNGNIALKSYHNKLGNTNGKRTVWYPNGKKKYEYHFNNGAKNGRFKEWYDNGVLAKECNYENGAKIEDCKRWYSDSTQIIPFQKSVKFSKENKGKLFINYVYAHIKNIADCSFDAKKGVVLSPHSKSDGDLVYLYFWHKNETKADTIIIDSNSIYESLFFSISRGIEFMYNLKTEILTVKDNCGDADCKEPYIRKLKSCLNENL